MTGYKKQTEHFCSFIQSITGAAIPTWFSSSEVTEFCERVTKEYEEEEKESNHDRLIRLGLITENDGNDEGDYCESSQDKHMKKECRQDKFV